jgi:hypothetical protein
MEYELLAAPTVQELSELVNEKLNDGWVLYGYPFVATAPFETEAERGQFITTCYQAVVRRG